MQGTLLEVSIVGANDHNRHPIDGSHDLEKDRLIKVMLDHVSED